ncbi:hypothetical protein PanWU01x14_260490, partial [Parasponia andersonii]
PPQPNRGLKLHQTCYYPSPSLGLISEA